MEKIRKVISQLLVCIIILSGVVLIPNVTAEWTKLELSINDLKPTMYEAPLKWEGWRTLESVIYLMPDRRLPTFVVYGELWFVSDNRSDNINGTLLFYLTKGGRYGEYVLNLLEETDYPDGMPFDLFGGTHSYCDIKMEATIVRGEIESGDYTVVVELINTDTQEEIDSDFVNIRLQNYVSEDSEDDTTDNNMDTDQTGDSDIPVDTIPNNNNSKKGIFGFTTTQFSIIAFLLLIVVLLSILLYSNFRKKQY
jgi:hypothetical protein